jgi:hypothetical protein
MDRIDIASDPIEFGDVLLRPFASNIATGGACGHAAGHILVHFVGQYRERLRLRQCRDQADAHAKRSRSGGQNGSSC